MQSPGNERGQAVRACLLALATRLVLPAAYFGLVGLYPIWRLDLGVGSAIAWLFVFVLVAPTATVVLLLHLSRRGRAGTSHRGRRP